jgi:hypothetical protein
MNFWMNSYLLATDFTESKDVIIAKTRDKKDIEQLKAT